MFNNFFFITLSKFLFHFSFVLILSSTSTAEVRLNCEGDTFMSKLRHAFSSSFRAGRSFKLRVESRNSLRSFKLSHETFRVSSLNTKGCMKVMVIVTQFGARGSKNESKYLHGCSLASSVSTFETLACVQGSSVICNQTTKQMQSVDKPFPRIQIMRMVYRNVSRKNSEG